MTARQLPSRPKWIAAAIAAAICGSVFAGCGGAGNSSSSSSTAAGPSSSATTPPASSSTAGSSTAATATPATAAAATTATCPTPAQVETATGNSYTGSHSTPAGGGGIVCEYLGATTAAVAIFAHDSQVVFAGQVAHTQAVGMQKISGVGSGAFGVDDSGRSIVNAYSNSSQTVVAAQATGSLASVEAFARVALADN